MALRPWVALSLILAVPAGLSGCIEPTKPVSSAVTLEEIDKEMATRRAVVKDLDIILSMSIDGLEKSGAFNGSMQVQPPSKVRMTGFNLALTLFAFVMTDDTFLLSIPYKEEFVRGSVRGQERKHPELIAAFAWLSETNEPGDERSIEKSSDASVTIVTHRAGKLIRSTTIERPSLFVTEIVLYDDAGADIARVDLSSYREVKPPEAFPGPSAWLPFSMIVRGRTEKGEVYSVKTTLKTAYLNEGIEPGAFELKAPPGVKIEEAR